MAELRIYNPDGSEAELSGNGVRQAVMYLRRNGWVEHDSFSVRTAAGEIRPRITGPSTCTVDMGRARLRSERDFPSGGEDGAGVLTAAGREFRFQFVQVGQPAVLDRGPDGARGARPRRYGRAIERHELFPKRTNVSFWRRTASRDTRAHLRARGGGDHVVGHRARRARRWRRCCAAWTAR